MKIKTLAAIALTLLTLSSCRFGTAIKMISEKAQEEMRANHDYENMVEEWGEVIDVEIDSVMPFTGIQTNGNIDIVFTQDSTFSIRMHGNKKAVEEYKYWWSESTMVFNTKEGYTYDTTKDNVNIDKNTPAITIYVTAPELTDIMVYGASDIKINDGLKQDWGLNLIINGAGNIDMEHADLGGMLTINIDGAGNIDLDDITCADNALIHIQGAGNIEVDNIKCKDIDTEVNGAGNIDLNVDCDNLKADINGVGNIDLKGVCNTLDSNFGGTMGNIDTDKLKVRKK